MAIEQWVRKGKKGDPTVFLVHGIRTRAEWYAEVQAFLENEGFNVGKANYGRYGLLKFLLPIPYFRHQAARRVEKQIIATTQQFEVDRVSIIAHSFGTYVIAYLLATVGHIKFERIVFCGSVVSYDFPFGLHKDRFKPEILNEVGSQDFWPVIARSVTWGYGDAGAYGFNGEYVYDRYHKGVSHSAFLKAAFCEENWLSFLKGAVPTFADTPMKPALWIRILSVVQIKYVILVALILLAIFFWQTRYIPFAPSSENPDCNDYSKLTAKEVEVCLRQ